MVEKVEEIRIRFVGDASGVKKASKEASESVGKAKDTAQKSTSAWGRLSQTLESLSPGFKKVSESFNKLSGSFKGLNVQSKGIGESIKAGISSASKSFSVGTLGMIGMVLALAVAINQLGKKVWAFAKEAARAWDPQKYDEAVGKYKKSVKELKTSIGAFTAPLVQGVYKALAALASFLTKIVKSVYAFLKMVAGFFKTLLQPVVDGVKKGIDAIKGAIDKVIGVLQGAINSIARFFGKGDIFKTQAAGAQKMASAMEDLGDSAEYAEGGLSSVDRLNTVDAPGDAATVEDMQNLGAEFEGIGSAFAGTIKNALGGVVDIFKKLDFKKLWSSFTEKGGKAIDALKQAGGSAWAWLTEKGGNVWTYLSDRATGLWQGFTEWGGSAWDSLTTKAGEVWDGIRAVGSDVWTSMAERAGELWQGFSDWAGSAWESMRSFALRVWETIRNAIIEMWSVVVSAMLGRFTEAKEKLLGIFSAMWSAVGTIFDTLVAGPIKSVISWLVDKVEWLVNKVKGVVDSVKNAFGKVGDFIGGAVGGIAGALGFASGGVVAPNDPHMVMVGDNRRETEVISPISTMKQAFMEAIGSAGLMPTGAGDAQPVNINMTLTLDGRTLAQQSYQYFQAEGVRRGSSI